MKNQSWLNPKLEIISSSVNKKGEREKWNEYGTDYDFSIEIYDLGLDDEEICY